MGKFTEVTQSVTTSVKKHSPEILMGLGIAGMLTAITLTVKATSKAVKLIDEKKKEKNVKKLTAAETFKTAWKCYIPTATLAVASTGCLISSTSVSLRRNAALATAYKLAETAHKEYREKVIETIGEKKNELIKDKVAKEKLVKDPVTNHEVILTENGNTLCYDAITGRYFKSDIDKIKRAINELNRRMRNENYISLNEFYDEIGLERVKVGDSLGWNIDRGYIDLDLRPELTVDDRPCAVIDFTIAPKYDYYRMF